MHGYTYVYNNDLYWWPSMAGASFEFLLETSIPS